MTVAVPRVALLAAGTKGLHFLRDIAGSVDVEQVFTYAHPAPGEPTIADFVAVATDAGSVVIDDRRPRPDALAAVDLVFAVGWQYLFADLGVDTVVFHDSLLPRHRGFAPTVSALIAGDPEIGVTALRPTDEVDAGPVIARRSVPVTHPLPIADAFDLLRGCYRDAALAVVAAWRDGDLSGVAQDAAEASYSIWRDAQDLVIDWSWPADRIARFVAALGAPYDGARTTLDGRTVVVGRAEVAADVPFVERHPGKVWRIVDASADDRVPVEVVCGDGMVRVGGLVDVATGEAVAVTRLRTRLGVPPRTDRTEEPRS